MCLLIGSPSVGKTLLLKRLNLCSNKGNYNDVGEAPSTIPTVGTNLVSISAGRKGEVTIRELGGCMAPIWSNYYNDCHAIMFMMDLSNRCQVSASCIQILEVLDNPQLQDVPILIILNKIDVDNAMTRVEFDYLVHMDSIVNDSHQKVTVCEISAKTGKGLQIIAKWIQQHAKPS